MTQFYTQFTNKNTEHLHVCQPARKKKKHQTIPEDKCDSLGNLLAQFDNKGLDLKHESQWPVTSKPWVICSRVDQRR